jgi:hypothetical protein
VTVPAAQAIMSSNVFFEPRVRRTPDANMSVDDDSKNDESAIDLPAITSIWECDKIEKLGEKGSGDESWQCHWCDLVFKRWNATKALHHVTCGLKQHMKVCSAKIGMPYRARYKVLVTMKTSKASSVAKAKERIDLSLDEDNVQLANKILLGPRKRKAVPAMLASSVEIASGGDSFAAGGMVRTSLQPTLFECTPPHSFALSGRFDAEHEEEKTIKNSGSKLNAAIADMIHAHGLPFSLSESPRFQRMLRLAKFAPPGYEPPKRKLVGGDCLL